MTLRSTKRRPGFYWVTVTWWAQRPHVAHYFPAHEDDPAPWFIAGLDGGVPTEEIQVLLGPLAPPV